MIGRQYYIQTISWQGPKLHSVMADMYYSTISGVSFRTTLNLEQSKIATLIVLGNNHYTQIGMKYKT
jgi:hypothetical protein